MLEGEIEYIHSQIVHFDDLSFKIKGWAVTIWAGVVALGAKEGSWIVVAAAIPTIIAFWVLDAYFKSYQQRSMHRMGTIEKFFDSARFFRGKGLREAFEKRDFGNFPIHDPVSNRTKELDKDIKKRYKEKTNPLRCLTRTPNVYVFYLLLLLGAIAMIVILLLVKQY